VCVAAGTASAKLAGCGNLPELSLDQTKESISLSKEEGLVKMRFVGQVGNLHADENRL